MSSNALFTANPAERAEFPRPRREVLRQSQPPACPATAETQQVSSAALLAALALATLAKGDAK